MTNSYILSILFSLPIVKLKSNYHSQIVLREIVRRNIDLVRLGNFLVIKFHESNQKVVTDEHNKFIMKQFFLLLVNTI